jgi:hypothetical protein
MCDGTRFVKHDSINLGQSLKDIFNELEFRQLAKRVLGEETPAAGDVQQGSLFGEEELEAVTVPSDLKKITDIPHHYILVETEQMLGIYRKGDIKAMHDFIQDDKSGFGAFMDLMLYERNRNWVETIKVQSAKEATFYAVGAGHLGGEEGVITLLRKAGFTVKPIK